MLKEFVLIGVGAASSVTKGGDGFVPKEVGTFRFTPG